MVQNAIVCWHFADNFKFSTVSQSVDPEVEWSLFSDVLSTLAKERIFKWPSNGMYNVGCGRAVNL
jgi:hypothetical protein